MRRRVFAGILVVIGLLLVGSGTLAVLSSAEPAIPVLPPPVVITSSGPVTTPSLSGTPSPTASASPTETEKPLPRGNPVKVTVSRRGKNIIDEHISDSIGLVIEGGKRVLKPPDDTVGWYKEGRWRAKPGYPGPSVLVAHISYHGKPGPFWLLPEVRKGDQIMVTYDSGDKVTFVVTDVEHTPKVALPVDKIWVASKDPVLWLVTCDPDTPFRNGHYAGNVLVRAVPVVG